MTQITQFSIGDTKLNKQLDIISKKISILAVASDLEKISNVPKKFDPYVSQISIDLMKLLQNVGTEVEPTEELQESKESLFFKISTNWSEAVTEISNRLAFVKSLINTRIRTTSNVALDACCSITIFNGLDYCFSLMRIEKGLLPTIKNVINEFQDLTITEISQNEYQKFIKVYSTESPTKKSHF